MGILSIFSSSIILLPQIQTLRIRTPPTMCLRQHHNNNNKLKLMVNHTCKRGEHLQFSLLSTEKDDDHNCVTLPNENPCFGYPFASCHELVLRMVDHENEHELALWNPSTNEVIKTLPPPPRPPPSVEYDECVEFYGLGLDPKTDDDYKVIRNLELEYEDGENFFRYRSYNHITELYSLKTDSWKHIACPHKDIDVHSTPIYINGFNYWPLATGDGRDFAIMSFDFANECFPSALIHGPCAATYKHGTGFLGDDPYKFLLAEYEGSLAVVVYLVKEKLFELWVWNDDIDNQSWSRRGEWAISDVRMPLGLYKNHQFYLEDSKGELVLFDCAEKKLKNLRLFGAGFCSMDIFPYYTK